VLRDLPPPPEKTVAGRTGDPEPQPGMTHNGNGMEEEISGNIEDKIEGEASLNGKYR
jgi:hypothetical protein